MIGFPISHKENENRRALVPPDVTKVWHPERLLVERGYGEVLGYADDDYRKLGAQVGSREQVLGCPIICDPKIGDADYLDQLSHQTVFGWVHAILNRDIADKLIACQLTAYAWEDMFESGRHVFWRNNEIAGEAAIAHAYLCHGVFPYHTRVAVIGRGNIARGAISALKALGAHVDVFDRTMEAKLREELSVYDVVVNAVLWDKMRKDHIVYRSDLGRMKRGAMIVDISCDRAGAIETSVPTTIVNPTYFVDGIRHYVVDHTPALFYKSTSAAISAVLPRFLNELIDRNPSEELSRAMIVRRGIIIDKRINEFQGRQ